MKNNFLQIFVWGVVALVAYEAFRLISTASPAPSTVANPIGAANLAPSLTSANTTPAQAAAQGLANVAASPLTAWVASDFPGTLTNVGSTTALAGGQVVPTSNTYGSGLDALLGLSN